MAGLTVNIVVLFSLILAVGMLVDDAIIVSEFAERRMAEGMEPRRRYSLAARAHGGPGDRRDATRVAAFSPLLFWPGIVGEFMKYMPITLIATLSASLVVALFFTPTLGALLGKAAPTPHDERAAERGLYMAHRRASRVRHPLTTLLATVALLVGVQMRLRQVRQRRRVLPQRRARLRPRATSMRAATSRSPRRTGSIRTVEERLLGMKELRTVYARAGEGQRGSNEITEDTVGMIQFEFVDWQHAPAGARHHGRDPRRRRPTFPASSVEVTAPQAPARRPASRSRCSSPRSIPTLLPAAAKKVAAMLAARPEIRDLDDGLPLPGIDWPSRSTRPRRRSTAPAPRRSALRCSSSPTA